MTFQQQLRIFSLLALLFLGACSDPHKIHDFYVYKKELYTTSSLSDFKLKHFQAYGSSYVYILNRKVLPAQSPERLETLGLCKEHMMNCRFLNFENFDKSAQQLVFQELNQRKAKRILVVSDQTDALAFFVGTYSVMKYAPAGEELDGILSKLGLPKESPLKEKILANF